VWVFEPVGGNDTIQDETFRDVHVFNQAELFAVTDKAVATDGVNHSLNTSFFWVV
jgi:hypothetical protein